MLLLLSTASCVFVPTDFLVVAVHGDGVLLATVVRLSVVEPEP